MKFQRLTRYELAKKLGVRYVKTIYSIEVSKFDDTDWEATSGMGTAFGSTRLEAIQALLESDEELEVHFELNTDDNE